MVVEDGGDGVWKWMVIGTKMLDSEREVDGGKETCTGAWDIDWLGGMETEGSSLVEVIVGGTDPFIIVASGRDPPRGVGWFRGFCEVVGGSSEVVWISVST